MAEDEKPQESSPRRPLVEWWGAFPQRGWLVSILLVIAFGVLVMILGPQVVSYFWVYAAFTVAALLILVWIGVHFVDLFTSQLSDNHSDEDKAKDKLAIKRMVRFSYRFMLSALFISFSPALLLWLLSLVSKSLPGNVYYHMVNSPVGLVRGCVHSPKDADWELACRFSGETKAELVDLYFAQWLVNIGGSAQYR
jgi:hypothetical protein